MHRSTLVKAALAATLLASPGLARAQSRAQPLTAPELNILLGAVWGNTEGAELSRIGQQQGQSEQVRAHAKHVADAHEQANQELKRLAQRVGVELPPPASATSNNQVHERLKQAQGKDFDKQYMQLAYEGRRIALAAHANAPEVVENEQLDRYARSFAPKIVTHLQDARNILQMLEESGS